MLQAVSLILVVIWQVAGWDGVSPSPSGYFLEGSAVGFSRVGSMLVGSLLSYRLVFSSSCFLCQSGFQTHHDHLGGGDDRPAQGSGGRYGHRSVLPALEE